MKMDIKNTVIELLTQYSDFKDNDQQLVAWFWKLEMEAHGYPASNTPTQTFFKLMAFGKLTSSPTPSHGFADWFKRKHPNCVGRSTTNARRNKALLKRI
jgi:hypothetical protein